MATGSHNLTTWAAKRIIGDNSTAEPEGALLHNGSGRGNTATGDTWIFYDDASASGTPWGFKHDQPNDRISFFGSGTNTSWLALGSGNFYVYGKVGIGYDPGTNGNTYKLYVNGTSYFTNTITGDILSGWHILAGRPSNTTNFNTYFETATNLHHDNPARTDSEITYNRWFASNSDQTNYSPSALNLPVVDSHILSFGIDNGAVYSRHIAFDIRTNAVYVKARNNNTWTGWEQLVRNTGTWGINVSGYATYASSYLANRGTVSGSSHAEALKAYFDSNKASEPRNALVAHYSSAHSNGSLCMGYFLSGYDNNPYGGFFVCHYDNPRYVGISNGTYTQHDLVTCDQAQTFTGNKSWGTSGAGGYLNGTATNGGINSIRIGDDVWLGDCNVGGIMGMKSTGTSCGFYFYNSSGTQIGQLYNNGSEMICNKSYHSSGGYLKSTLNSNTVQIGSQNNGFCHITSSANIPFWFNRSIQMAQGTTIGAAGSQYRPFQLYLGRNSTAGSNAINAANPLIEFSNSDRSQYGQLVYTDYDSVRAPDGLTWVGNQANSWFQAPRVFGAVWNDYAEYRETKEIIQPGRCVVETGMGDLILSTARLQRGCEIVSDTFGFAIGETDKCKTPTACAGRVLAYLYEDNSLAKPGDPVCSGPNGTVSLMTHEEEIEWPSCIIATVSEIPDYEEWEYGSPDEFGNKEKLKVDGRIWIRVR